MMLHSGGKICVRIPLMISANMELVKRRAISCCLGSLDNYCADRLCKISGQDLVTVQTFNFRTSRRGICQCLVVQSPMDNISEEISQAHQCSLRIKVRFSCAVIGPSVPRNWVPIKHAVVYYAWAALIFGAGIKCWHCRYLELSSGYAYFIRLYIYC